MLVILLLCHITAAPVAKRVYVGVYAGNKMKDLGDLSAVKSFERDAGKNVAIIHIFQAWGTPDGMNRFDPNAMTAIREHGSLPLLTWAPRAPREAVNQPEFALRNIIDGKFDDYITQYALDIKRWGHPLFLRFAHEMNGTWYPWSESVNGNRPGDYVKAWRHVHDIFKHHEVTNVTWVWCPSRKGTKPQKLRALYPGDQYVDWLGMDGYNDTRQKRWQTMEEIFGDLYRELNEMSAKPMMIVEFSTTEKGGSKAGWIVQAFHEIIPGRFPRIGAVVWFNRRFSPELDWRIELSPSARKAFEDAVASPIYLDNRFGSINESPIPEQ